MALNKLFAGIIFFLTSPFLLVLVIIIIIDDGFPIIFKQKRVGKDNTIFTIYKFRTMKTETPPNIATHLLKDSDNHNTRYGKYFRKFSLDELPQLFNIIKGDMVFIGPRPALYNQRDLIKLRKDNKLDKMIPGITGWAQINGRDEISIKEKVDLEIYYKLNKSLFIDIKILIYTVFKVFTSKGVSH